MTLSTMDIPFSPEMGGRECLSALGWSRTHRHEAFERWQHEDGVSVIVFTPDGRAPCPWLACSHYTDGVKRPLPLTGAELAAKVRRMDDGWRWVSMSVSVAPDHIRPLFQTRGECVTDCKRTALLYLAEQAIEREQARPSLRYHKHRPTRDALHSMRESGCFSCVELEEMAKRMGLR